MESTLLKIKVAIMIPKRTSQGQPKVDDSLRISLTIQVPDSTCTRTNPSQEKLTQTQGLFRLLTFIPSRLRWFWIGASAFKFFGVPFDSLTRLLLNDILDTWIMNTLLHIGRQSNTYATRDLAVPCSTDERIFG